MLELLIKALTGEQYEVRVSAEATLLDLRQAIAEKSSVPVSEQRLIYNGRALRPAEDPRKLTELGVGAQGRFVHLVPRPPATAPSTGSSSTTSTSATQNLSTNGSGRAGTVRTGTTRTASSSPRQNNRRPPPPQPSVPGIPPTTEFAFGTVAFEFPPVGVFQFGSEAQAGVPDSGATRTGRSGTSSAAPTTSVPPTSRTEIPDLSPVFTILQEVEDRLVVEVPMADRFVSSLTRAPAMTPQQAYLHDTARFLLRLHRVEDLLHREYYGNLAQQYQASSDTSGFSQSSALRWNERIEALRSLSGSVQWLQEVRLALINGTVFRSEGPSVLMSRLPDLSTYFGPNGRPTMPTRRSHAQSSSGGSAPRTSNTAANSSHPRTTRTTSEQRGRTPSAAQHRTSALQPPIPQGFMFSFPFNAPESAATTTAAVGQPQSSGTATITPTVPQSSSNTVTTTFTDPNGTTETTTTVTNNTTTTTTDNTSSGNQGSALQDPPIVPTPHTGGAAPSTHPGPRGSGNTGNAFMPIDGPTLVSHLMSQVMRAVQGLPASMSPSGFVHGVTTAAGPNNAQPPGNNQPQTHTTSGSSSQVPAADGEGQVSSFGGGEEWMQQFQEQLRQDLDLQQQQQQQLDQQQVQQELQQIHQEHQRTHQEHHRRHQQLQEQEQQQQLQEQQRHQQPQP